jgi:hypothetical protein
MRRREVGWVCSIQAMSESESEAEAGAGAERRTTSDVGYSRIADVWRHNYSKWHMQCPQPCSAIMRADRIKY